MRIITRVKLRKNRVRIGWHNALVHQIVVDGLKDQTHGCHVRWSLGGRRAAAESHVALGQVSLHGQKVGIKSWITRVTNSAAPGHVKHRLRPRTFHVFIQSLGRRKGIVVFATLLIPLIKSR